jgi:hypothetical protein
LQVPPTGAESALNRPGDFVALSGSVIARGMVRANIELVKKPPQSRRYICM